MTWPTDGHITSKDLVIARNSLRGSLEVQMTFPVLIIFSCTGTPFHENQVCMNYTNSQNEDEAF